VLAPSTRKGNGPRSRSRSAIEWLFGKYAGTEIKIDDQEHVILREDEVLGILE
jgi:co-chaperonin GroES (HSP10)